MQRSLMGLFLLAVTIGLLALAAGSIRSTLQERWARESRPIPARERVFSVNVSTATPGTAEPKILAFGEIRSARTLDLRAPVSGTIKELSPGFVEGGRVQATELLVRLDPANAETALAVAQTEANEAAAELTEAQAALILARDELAAARAQSELRAAALARQEMLVSRGVGTEAAIETAALAHSSAEQAVLGKRQALAQAEARIAKAERGIERTAIRLDEARRNLDNTELFAEFAGVLSGVTVVEGGLVGTNEKIGRLIDPDALEVAFRLSNTQFARLVEVNGGRISGEVTVTLDVLGEDVTATGQIVRDSAEVGEGLTGRLIFARLTAGTLAALRPGDFVTVTVVEPPLEQVVVVPSAAVDSAGTMLVLGENDRLESIQVTVLRRQGDSVIVRGRDLYGREYVRTRSPLLGAGIRVKPVRDDNAGIPTTPAEPEMIELTAERRARLVAFIEGNAFMPADVKQRILARLQEDRVPAEVVNRIESRMGG